MAKKSKPLVFEFDSREASAIMFGLEMLAVRVKKFPKSADTTAQLASIASAQKKFEKVTGIRVVNGESPAA